MCRVGKILGTDLECCSSPRHGCEQDFVFNDGPAVIHMPGFPPFHFRLRRIGVRRRQYFCIDHAHGAARIRPLTGVRHKVFNGPASNSSLCAFAFNWNFEKAYSGVRGVLPGTAVLPTEDALPRAVRNAFFDLNRG